MTSNVRSRSTATPANSWLARFCAGLIEAVWLGAAAVIPILFNPEALGGFEPSKAGFLRIAAVVTIAAWFVRSVIGRSAGTKSISKALALALALLAGAYLLSTAFSVCPAESLWGTRDYLQGTATALSGMVLCVAIGVHLRTRDQAQRLISTIILASVPVALYALVQAAGRDPINFGLVERTSSFAGHPVYLGNYLGMVVPLTLWQSAQFLRSANRPARMAGRSVYFAVAVLQFAAFASSRSRGPLFGLTAALAILAIGAAASTRLWRWLAAGVAVTLLPLGFFVALNLHNGAAMRAASGFGIARYADTLNLRGTDRFRTEHWHQASRFLIDPVPLAYPAGDADSWHLARRVIGYGPETLQHVLPQRLTTTSQVINIEDHFHNHLWDLWYSLGCFGVAAFLALIVVIIYHAFSAAGLLEPAQVRTWTFVLMIGAVIGTGAALAIGAAFLPLGLIGGLTIATAAWPLLARLRRRAPPEVEAAPKNTLTLALVAGLIGGGVSDSFSFPIGSTLALFWLYTGLIAAAQCGLDVTATTDSQVSRTGSRESGPRQSPAASADHNAVIYVGSLMLLTVIFAFIHQYSADVQTISSVLHATLLKGSGLVVWAVLLPTMLITIGVWMINTAVDGGPIRGGFVLRTLALLVAVAIVYSWTKAAQIAHIGAFPEASASPAVVLQQAAGYQWLVLVWVLVVSSLGILWALSIAGLPLRKAPSSMLRHIGAVLTILLLSAAGAWWVTLRFWRTSIDAKWGTVLADFQRPELACAVLRKVVAEDPSSTYYREILSRTLINMAQRDPAPEGFDRLMADAENTLLPGWPQAHGLNPIPFYLGRCYLLWAANSSEEKKRFALGKKCAAAFDRALFVEPEQPLTWLDSALAHSLLLAAPEEAAYRRNKARQLLSRQSPSVWADFYRNRCLETRPPNLRAAYADEALYYFSRASESASEPAERGESLLAEGSWRFFVGDVTGAQRALFASLPLRPATRAWEIYAALSEIAKQQGDRRGCLENLAKAIELAPPERKATLIGAQRQLLGL